MRWAVTAINPETPMYFTRPEFVGEEYFDIDYVAAQQHDVLRIASLGSLEPSYVPTVDEVRREVERAYAGLELINSDPVQDLEPIPAHPSAEIAPVISINSGQVVEQGGFMVDNLTVPDAVPNPVALTGLAKIKAHIISRAHELLGEPEMTVRSATIEDIDALVDIDMKAFERVYRGYGMSQDELRADLRAKFTHRFNKVGPDWIQILMKEGRPSGFLMCCPTNKSPEEFESWEKTTDNGTLESTYDEDGKNLYIVSLSMTPEASAQNGQDMLIANVMGRLIERGMDRGYFESRLPGLRTWAKIQTRREGRDIDSLSDDERMDYATRYFNLTTVVNGKEVPRDRLIRLYSEVGCKFVKLAPDAYQDEPSMNFGAVGVCENPLPSAVRGNSIVRKVVGKAVQLISRSKTLTEKVL